MFILFRSVSLSHEYYCLFSPLLVPLWSCYFFYQSSFSLKSYYSKSKHDSEINSIIFKLVVICSLYYLLLRNYISLYFHPLYFNPIYWLVAYRSLYHKYLLIFLVLLLDHQIREFISIQVSVFTWFTGYFRKIFEPPASKLHLHGVQVFLIP